MSKSKTDEATRSDRNVRAMMKLMEAVDEVEKTYDLPVVDMLFVLTDIANIFVKHLYEGRKKRPR